MDSDGVGSGGSATLRSAGGGGRRCGGGSGGVDDRGCTRGAHTELVGAAEGEEDSSAAFGDGHHHLGLTCRARPDGDEHITGVHPRTLAQGPGLPLPSSFVQGVPESMDRLLARALSPRPEQRLPTADQLLVELRDMVKLS